jgi:hypothetical protein
MPGNPPDGQRAAAGLACMISIGSGAMHGFETGQHYRKWRFHHNAFCSSVAEPCRAPARGIPPNGLIFIMILRLIHLASALAVIFAIYSPGTASAEPAAVRQDPAVIGNVVGLTPAVHGSLSGLLSIGSTIHQGETIQTGPSGVVELQFLDNTHLMLGSRSSVTLDSFVYAGNGKAKSVVLQFARGAFRFATGDSAKRAYRIHAPQASIGVRGTRFQVDSRTETSSITLYEGKTYICPPHRPQRYCKIVSPGQTALIGPDRIIRIVSASQTPTEHCIGSPGSKICDIFGK